MQKTTRNLKRLALTAGALLTCVLGSHAHAMLIVEATVTPSGGGFSFDIAIDNATFDDFSIVSIIDAPLGDATIGATLLGPAGFATSYDPGLGFVDFIEDTNFFAAGTRVEGFSFDSAFDASALQFANFQALTVFGDLVEGAVTVLRPAVVVPEPGVLPLFLLGLLAVSGLRRTAGDAPANRRRA